MSTPRSARGFAKARPWCWQAWTKERSTRTALRLMERSLLARPEIRLSRRVSELRISPTLAVMTKAQDLVDRYVEVYGAGKSVRKGFHIEDDVAVSIALHSLQTGRAPGQKGCPGPYLLAGNHVAGQVLFGARARRAADSGLLTRTARV